MEAPMDSPTDSPPTSIELCALCREPKTEPEDLSCGHSFCRVCLDDLRSYSQQKWARCCPLCRQPIHGVNEPNDNETDDNSSSSNLDENLLPIYEETSEFMWDSEVYAEVSLNFFEQNDDIYFYYSESETSGDIEIEQETEDNQETNQATENNQA